MRSLKFKTLAVVVAALSTTVGQSCNAWTLSPMKIERDMTPGQSMTDVLVVDNAGASDIKRYEVKLVDWSLDEKGQLQYFEPGVIKESLASRLSCTPMQFKCAPSERKLLRFTLNLPENLSPGEHTVGIQVLEVVIPPKDSATGKINVGVSVKCGFLCAMTIVVPKASPAQLEPLSLDLRRDGKEASIELKVRNSGNVRSRPKWCLVLRDMNGNTIFKDESEHIVLRDSDRLISVPVKATIQPGSYKLEGRLDQGLSYPVQEIEKKLEVTESITEPKAK